MDFVILYLECLFSPFFQSSMRINSLNMLLNSCLFELVWYVSFIKQISICIFLPSLCTVTELSDICDWSEALTWIGETKQTIDLAGKQDLNCNGLILMATNNLILVDKRVNPPFYCYMYEGTSDYLLQKRDQWLFRACKILDPIYCMYAESRANRLMLFWN